jgi:2,5-diamino-6-(ribosylamino)-4(3H)-pyrimidinone 5'-phosphate reductase
VIVLVSKRTPQSYLKHLEERNYDYIVVGDDHVDLKAALEELNKRYKVKVVRTDSGPTLTNLMLEQGLIDEVSLLISPALASRDNPKIFGKLKTKGIKLKLIKQEVVAPDKLLLLYKVLK